MSNIKTLIEKAKSQGYLELRDIKEHLPEELIDQDNLRTF